jgi:hypothetical protein
VSSRRDIRAGESLSVASDLPRGGELIPAVPHLQGVDPSGLSAAELDLARRVQVVLPRGADPAAVRARVKQWRCVEKVTLPPEISLPKS